MSSEFPKEWKDIVLAVVGGDEREQEIARLARNAGATVRAYGFPWPEEGIENIEYASSPSAAMKGANVVLFPIPGMTLDGSIFATETIIPDAKLLSNMAENGHIILGMADKGLKGAAKQRGIELHEYEHDQELMLLRAPAIVEAALKVIIENTDITIHDAKICVVGQGNIGTVLTRTLILLGAHVTVAARNPVQRANAYALGASSIDIDQFKASANDYDMILSTASAPIIDSSVIDSLSKGTLLVDLAAPPGSIDLDYAKKAGLTAVWARALGRRAPITVGGSQWSGISKTIQSLITSS